MPVAPALQNLLIPCDLSAGVRPEACPVCCKNPPVWALLTDAVAGEGEAFVVWLCEEAEGAELAVPAQPDLLGAAAGNGPGKGNLLLRCPKGREAPQGEGWGRQVGAGTFFSSFP